VKYILIILTAVLISFVVNVKAQDVISKEFKKNLICSTHEFVTNDLQKKHNQFRKWWALSSQNELIELFVDNKKGTWTIILSKPDGLTCGLVGGNNDGSNFNIDNSSSEEET